MSTMNAESAAFVPASSFASSSTTAESPSSNARSRKLSLVPDFNVGDAMTSSLPTKRAFSSSVDEDKESSYQQHQYHSSNPAAAAAAHSHAVTASGSSGGHGSSKIPRSTSASNSPHFEQNQKFNASASASASSSSASHARSSSAPGSGASNRGPGGRNGTSSTSQRGRGTSRGRGGGGGGGASTRQSGREASSSTHSSSTSSSHKRNSSTATASLQPPHPPPQPAVHLDSVEEFPSLGGSGGEATHHHIPKSPSLSFSKVIAAANVSADHSNQLKPQQQQQQQQQQSDSATVSDVKAPSSSENKDAASASASAAPQASGAGSPIDSKKPVLSFARVVAHSPPASAPQAAATSTSASQQHQSQSQSSAAPAAANAASSSPSTATSTSNNGGHHQQQNGRSASASVSSASASSQSSPPTSTPSSLAENVQNPTSPSLSLAQSQSAPHDVEASSAAMKPSNSKTGTSKKKKRPAKDQQHGQGQPGQGQGQGQGQGHQQAASFGESAPYGVHNGVQPFPGQGQEGYERDPFHVVVPDYTERPYFEPQNGGMPGPDFDPSTSPQLQQQAQMPPPLQQPGLTPVQIAFLKANGLSVEGMPNLADDAAGGMSLEALDSYYNVQMEQAAAAAATAAASSSNNSGPGGGNLGRSTSKKEGGSKRSKRDRNHSSHPHQQHMNGNGHLPYQDFNNQPYGYYDYDAAPYYAAADQQQQQPFQEGYQEQVAVEGPEHPPQPAQALSPSFHFHADVPDFKPRSLSIGAQEFVPKSPQANGNVPGFSPSVSESQDEAGDAAAPDTKSEAADEKAGAQNSKTEEETPKPAAGVLPAVQQAAETVSEAVSSAMTFASESASEIVSGDSKDQSQEVSADGEQSERQDAEPTEVQSPPHSTFSLLPPVSVDDVLEKAQSLVETVSDSAKDAVAQVGETVQAVVDGSSPAEQHEHEHSPEEAKDNLDELDIPTETEIEEEAQAQPEEASSTVDDDDVKLPQPSRPLDDSQRHAKESTTSTAASSVAPDFSQHSLTPSEVEEELSNANAGANGQAPLALELEDSSASEDATKRSPFEIISVSSEQCGPDGNDFDLQPVNDGPSSFKIVSSTDDSCEVENSVIQVAEGDSSAPASLPALEIIATSEDRCTIEEDDKSREQRASTVDSLASTDSTASTFVRSLAPSPPSRPVEPVSTSSKPEMPPLSIPTPPVVISPSTPISPVEGQASLRNGSSPERPPAVRQASEAEKLEAIRLVRELRSEPSTPLVEGSEFTAPASTVGNGDAKSESADEPEDFKFDLSGRFSEYMSSKRKRGKAEDNGDDEDGDKERKKQNGGDDGEAPSLTMSIFSGALIPRKEWVWTVIASIGINFGLPFVNGVMLGLGEIVARDWFGPLLGLVRLNRNSDSSSSAPKSFSTSGLGLRNAGTPGKRGGAQDVPGHAAAKTAVEAVTENVTQGA